MNQLKKLNIVPNKIVQQAVREVIKEEEREAKTMYELIGKYVTTIDGHSGMVINTYKATGCEIQVHIKEEDGRIWFCPENDIVYIKEKENVK